MKILLTLFISANLVLFSPMPLEASKWNRKRWQSGPEVMLGAGFDLCAKSGDANCRGVDHGLLLAGSAGYRFSRAMGLYLDLAHGKHSTDSDELTNLNAFGSLRLFGAVSPSAEAWLTLGLGYLRSQWDNSSDYYHSTANGKVGIGAAFEITPTMLLGASADYILHMNELGSVCIKGENCKDFKGDWPNEVHLLAFLKVRF